MKLINDKNWKHQGIGEELKGEVDVFNKIWNINNILISFNNRFAYKQVDLIMKNYFRNIMNISQVFTDNKRKYIQWEFRLTVFVNRNSELHK